MLALWNWFARLYELEVSGLVPQYRRVSLPEAGGVSAQPARLLDELTWLAQCRNALFIEQANTQRRRAGGGG